MRIHIVSGASLLLGLMSLQKTCTAKDIIQLSAEIQSVKDEQQKKEITAELVRLKPQTTKDVETLVSIAETTTDVMTQRAALRTLENTDKTSNSLAGAYFRALNSKNREVRIVSIQNLGKLKAKAAAPKLRDIVKDFGKMRALAFKTAKKISMRKTYEASAEYCNAAIALGDLKDEEAIPLLVEKLYDLEDCAGSGLSGIGQKAIPSLLNLARKEGVKDAWARQALGNIKDTGAKPELLNILKTEKNRDVRISVRNALLYNMADEGVLETMFQLYRKEKDVLFIPYIKNKQVIPFLTEIAKTDSSSNTRESAVVYLGEIGDPSVIPVLKDTLLDRNRNIRELSLHALIPIADTEMLKYLKGHLETNTGMIGNVDHDRMYLHLIVKRLESGKRGATSFDEMEDGR